MENAGQGLGRPQTTGGVNESHRKSLKKLKILGCSRSQPDNVISESPHPCNDDSAFRRHASSPVTFPIQEVDTASLLTKTSSGTIKSRPGTAPADIQQERLFRRQPLLGGTQKARRVRGASGRVLETRLDELRADENMRAGLLKRVDSIVALRESRKRRVAKSGTRLIHRQMSRMSIQHILNAHPLDTERKVDLILLFRGAGVEANRATQWLRDPSTKALLNVRENERKRAKEVHRWALVESAKRENASRRIDKTNEQMIWTRRRQTRNEKNQARMWLVLVKMLVAFAWTESRLADIMEAKRQQEAKMVITRFISMVARERLKMRLKAARRVIDERLSESIRRWKKQRSIGATVVLRKFLSAIKSSGMQTRVKLLAYRVAHAHVQLARMQRWWRSRRLENQACRRILFRLWEKEVDKRVDAKIDETFRAQSSQENTEGLPKWSSGREGSSTRAKVARQIKEAQTRGERARLMLDPLINPPSEVKVKMCTEYLKMMAVRHLEAVERYQNELDRITKLQLMNKAEQTLSLMKVSRTEKARLQKAKEAESEGLPARPRWRTMATPREVKALVDAGVEYVKGTFWLWEARTPYRYEDGTLVAESLPTPEELAARVAGKFRYDHAFASVVETGREESGLARIKTTIKMRV